MGRHTVSASLHIDWTGLCDLFDRFGLARIRGQRGCREAADLHLAIGSDRQPPESARQPVERRLCRAHQQRRAM